MSSSAPTGSALTGSDSVGSDSTGSDSIELFGCFHVSQRNTFTGRLTPAMLRDVLGGAARTAGLPTKTYAG
jgi:uracil-DNA glycosylase